MKLRFLNPCTGIRLSPLSLQPPLFIIIFPRRTLLYFNPKLTLWEWLCSAYGSRTHLPRMKILCPQTDRRMRHLIHYFIFWNIFSVTRTTPRGGNVSLLFLREWDSNHTTSRLWAWRATSALPRNLSNLCSLYLYTDLTATTVILKQKTFFDYLIPQIKSIKIAVRFLTLQIYKLCLTIPNF